jgi:radical SAM protein with 4Fe4S-binding SPASM domain
MFPKVFLEITSACNLACPFCPPTRRQAEFMGAERFRLILDRLAGHGDHLYFHVKGEPLLHPRLGGFLAEAAARSFSVSLTTNGSLLGGATDILLGAASLRKLSVSLHSQVGLDGLGDYWKGLEGFLDAHRRKPSFPVSLRLWNRKDGGLPEGTGKIWDLIRARYGLEGGLLADLAASPSLRLDDRVYLNLDEEFTWPDPALDEVAAKGSCHGLRNQVAILVDGSVVPCCLDGEGVMTLGNILESSLDAILASPRARAIREGFARGDLVEALCRTCGYRRRFPARGPARAG